MLLDGNLNLYSARSGKWKMSLGWNYEAYYLQNSEDRLPVDGNKKCYVEGTVGMLSNKVSCGECSLYDA